MRIYIFVYWIIILAIPIKLQATAVDSLLLALQQVQQPSKKVELLNQLADEYVDIDRQQVPKYRLESLEEAEKLEDISTVININLQLVDDYIAIGDYSSALLYSQQLDKKYGHLLSRQQYEFFLDSKRSVYLEGGDYRQAQEVVLNLLALYQKTGDKEGIGNSEFVVQLSNKKL